MANWVDLVIIVSFIGIIIAEFKRGFGKAVFDLIALLCAVRLASFVISQLASSNSNIKSSEGLMYIMAFVAIGALLIFIGQRIHGMVLLSADHFDPVLGAVVGVFGAVVFCHAFVYSLSLAGGAVVGAGALTHSVFGMEFLEFGGYHRLLEFLYNFNKG